ncbi:MAG TPA: hypothetical protein VGG13_02765 [Candidatus Saccharimonadales bacterium]|jgi:uncharacterized membrane protein YphA (DoxX/SURF4 family)
MNIKGIDKKVIAALRTSFLPVARVAVFVVYFYFGILKLFGQSPASPLAQALTAKTIGLQHFNLAFNILAVYECVIGILFLFPKMTRVVIPLLFIHLIIVCSPLILVSNLAFTKPFVPTLEGQYIIKNVVIIALAIGVAAQTKPLALGKRDRTTLRRG